MQLRLRAGFNSFLFGFCYCLLVFFPFKLPEFLPLPLPHLLQQWAWSVYPKQTGSKAKAELRTSHRPLPGCSFPFQRAPDKKGCVSVVFKLTSEAGKALVLLAAATAVTWQEIFFFSFIFSFSFLFSPLSPPSSLPSSFPSPLSPSSFLIFNFPFYFASERCWWHYSSRLHFRAVAESCELKVSKTVIQTLCSSSCSVWCKIRKNSWQGLHIHSILLSWWQGMCCLVKRCVSALTESNWQRKQALVMQNPCL